MHADSAIVREKLDQASGILEELNIDCWLTFVRETTESGDPVLPHILGRPVTWQSAFLVRRDGGRVAIVGRYEDEAVRSTGAWSQVVGLEEMVLVTDDGAEWLTDPQTDLPLFG